MCSSTISKIILEGREFYVKRDDLIDPFLAGNKYRKLYKLLNTPSNHYETIISYGGTQSNAMLAIAKMCEIKGWKFIYYTKPISKTQKLQDYGNYFESIRLGMNHIEIEYKLYRDFISSIRFNLNEKTFIIDQGGAIDEAYDGLDLLAQEILNQKKSLEIPNDINSLATPSGTGTTALYLAKSLPNFTIYTVPCVGDVEYLKKQLRSLCDIPKNLIILDPIKKFHFSKPYLEFLEIYKKLKSKGIEFDLLYSPSMWLSLLKQTEDKILYIHSGGVSGNKTMLKRYELKSLN